MTNVYMISYPAGKNGRVRDFLGSFHERRIQATSRSSGIEPVSIACRGKAGSGRLPRLKPERPAAGLNDRWRVPGVCLVLAAITFAVFGQTLRHEFVNFDDNLYVYDNPR